MREPEGIETQLPGKSSERPWSKRREPQTLPPGVGAKTSRRLAGVEGNS